MSARRVGAIEGLNARLTIANDTIAEITETNGELMDLLDAARMDSMGLRNENSALKNTVDSLNTELDEVQQQLAIKLVELANASQSFDTERATTIELVGFCRAGCCKRDP